MHYWWLLSIVLFAILVAIRIRSLFQHKFSVRSKLLFCSLLVGLASIAATGWQAITKSTEALFEQRRNSVEAIRTARAAQIEESLRLKQAQIAGLAISDVTKEALVEFSAAFENLSSEMLEIGLSPNQLIDELDAHTSGLIPAASTEGKVLQWLVHQDPMPPNTWTDSHVEHASSLCKATANYELGEVALIDIAGNVVFASAAKEHVGHNLDSEPFSDSRLAAAFRLARDTLSAGQVHFEDGGFAPAPDATSSGFAVSPVFIDDAKIGVLAVSTPMQQISRFLSQSAGMGSTAHLYLVSQQGAVWTRHGMAAHSVAPLVASVPVRRGLNGQPGTIIGDGFRGNRVLSSFEPISIEGSRYVLVAEVDDKELRESAEGLQESVLSAAIATSVVVAILAFIVTTLLIHKQFENELIKSARFDKLTGLPNSELFHHRLKNAFEKHKRNPRATFAVLFLDFDRFKMVNDLFGHAVGDMLLQEIANRLRANVNHTDSIATDIAATTIARLGGDEFVILLDTSRGRPSAQVVADKLLKELNRKYRLGSHEISSTASIGIVLSDSSYTESSELLRDADTAMYEAKNQGKACSVLFDVSMQEEIRQRIRFENNLREALANKDFELVFQPIISLGDGVLTSVETLIRWQRPDGQYVSPDSFIPIAEDLGLIVEISEWVFEHACECYASWKREFGTLAPKTISVNMSQKHFASGDLLKTIKAILEKYEMKAQELQMEITETAVMADAQVSMEILSELKKLGTKIALDDFGTGHSTLAMLRDFPIDCVKIDRAFTSGAHCSKHMAALVHAVALLATNLGMDTVAEGIEKEEDFLAVQNLGCVHGQGYFLGRPLSKEAFWQYLAERTKKPLVTTAGAAAFANPGLASIRMGDLSGIELQNSSNR